MTNGDEIGTKFRFSPLNLFGITNFLFSEASKRKGEGESGWKGKTVLLEAV
jgi:hypothetical protein